MKIAVDRVLQISEILRCIEKATNFIRHKTDPAIGLQSTFVGPSRHELQIPSPFPPEQFTTLLALDLLDGKVEPNLINIWRQSIKGCQDFSKSTANFFYPNNSYSLPDDVDTTAIFYLTHAQHFSNEELLQVGQSLLQNVTKTGIIQTYFPPRGNHIHVDCIANANCMRLLYRLGLEADAENTESDIYENLVSNEFLNGSRYYFAPDTFLYFVARAVGTTERSRSLFLEPTLKAILQRMDTSSQPLGSAQKILALHYLNVLHRNEVDWHGVVENEIQNLIEKQMEDGGWKEDSVFKLGSKEIFLGGREITSIFALAALISYADSLTCRS